MNEKQIDNAFDFMHEIVKGRIKQEKRNIKNAAWRYPYSHEYALNILQGLHRDFIHCRESWVERNPKQKELK